MTKFWLLFFWIALFFTSCEKQDPNALFTELNSKKTGIKFKNLVRESEEFNVLTYGYFYQGGGVAVGDINNDGLPDIYFTGNMMASKLYLNQGNFEFEEITESAGVAAAGLWNTGVTMADVNGDGWLDIYVCRSAANDPEKRRNLLFINNGDLTFTEKAKEFGLDDPGYSTQATFFDYDQDGDLDMFLLNHSTQDYAGFSRITSNLKTRVDKLNGDKLYRNDGDRFIDVTESSGIISNVLGFGLAVTVTDVNNDGWLDMYVSNDYSEEDYLYINQKDGRFKESVRDYFGHVSFFSMGADGADLNNDLLPDLITLDMLPEYSYNQKMIMGPENYDKYRELVSNGFHTQTMRNMLQLNQGNGYFSEIGQLAGISNTDWSWAVLAADYNNNGWKDLLITNGYSRNYLDMDFLNYLLDRNINLQKEKRDVVLSDLIKKMPPIQISNYLYANNGDLTFTDKATAWGIKGNSVSNAAAYADLDNDGDLDLIIYHTNQEVSIYRNNSERLTGNNFLKIKFKGNDRNKFGIGSKVLLYAGDQHFHQELIPVRGYQSSVNPELLFGLGQIDLIDSLVVFWPNSKHQTITNIKANESLLLDQENAVLIDREIPEDNPVFSVVEDNLGLNFNHKEAYHLDFRIDRLLPNGISTENAPLVKGDFNGDGLEDFFMGGAIGFAGKLFQQLQNGNFKEIQQDFFESDKQFKDTDGIFFDANGNGFQDLYVVSGGTEYPADSPLYQDRLYLNDGNGNFTKTDTALPQMWVSGSTVTAGDFDKDGKMDLFVGGRIIPGKYPIAPRSYLLQNKGNGNFEDVTSSVCTDLMNIGLVTDARFLNLDGDEWIDLVVVGEWMDISIFTNKEGNGFQKNIQAIDQPTGGWWLTIEAADFDQDGDLDLVIGNYGINNPYKPSLNQPSTLVYNDFDKNGSTDPIFNYYIADTNAFAFSRDELVGQIPFLKKKFPNYKSFAKTPIAEFFSKEETVGTDTLTAQILESVYLENNGLGHFTLKKLPIEAQFSPLFGIAVLDINSDGILDIIAGGNMKNTRVSTGQYDANYGMVFLGDGKGSFKTLHPKQSGLRIHGDVRDIHTILIKKKVYSIFSRNNDSIKVFSLNP